MAARGNDILLLVALIACYGAFIGLVGGLISAIFLSLLRNAFGGFSRRSWFHLAFLSALLGSAVNYAVFLLRQSEYSPSMMIGIATLVVGGAFAFLLPAQRQEQPLPMSEKPTSKISVSPLTVVYIAAAAVIALVGVLTLALLAVTHMSDESSPLQTLRIMPQSFRAEILLRLGYTALVGTAVVLYQVYIVHAGSGIWRAPRSFRWHRHHAALCSYGWVAVHTFWVMGAVDEAGRFFNPGVPTGSATTFAWWFALSGWLALCVVLISILTRVGLATRLRKSPSPAPA